MERKPNKNLPWQRHFKSRVLPACQKLSSQFADNHVVYDSDESMFDEEIPIMRSDDCSRPPRDLEYGVVTLVFESSKRTTQAEVDRGLYLVREISSNATISANGPAVNERLFMDRTR